MKIETKLNVGTYAYIMNDNKIKSVEIRKINIVLTQNQWMRPETNIAYHLSNFTTPFSEGDVHATKEDLLESL